MNSKLAIVTVFLIAMLIGVGLGILYTSINNTGTVNPSANISPSTANLNWETINQGTSKNLTLTLTNIGTGYSLPLRLIALPPTGLTLEWNCTNYEIAPSESITADFRLTAAADAPVGPFNFDITIEG